MHVRRKAERQGPTGANDSTSTSFRKPLAIAFGGIVPAVVLFLVDIRDEEPLGQSVTHFVYIQGLANLVYAYAYFAAVYVLFRLPEILKNSRIPRLAATGKWLSQLHDTFRSIIGTPPLLMFAVGALAIYISSGDEDPIGDLFLSAVFLGGLFVQALRHIASKEGRDEVYSKLKPLGIYLPFLYSALITWLALAFFTALTDAIQHYELVRFSEPNLAETWRIAMFYAWHLADSVPLADIPNTTKWQEPLQYRDLKLGLLVLTFKILVITPILVSFQGYWVRTRNEYDGDQAA